MQNWCEGMYLVALRMLSLCRLLACFREHNDAEGVYLHLARVIFLHSFLTEAETK